MKTFKFDDILGGTNLDETRALVSVQASKRLAHEPTIGHRQLNQNEVRAATNFTTMQKTWQKQVKGLVKAWGTVRALQIDEVVEQIIVAVGSGNTRALAGLQVSALGSDLLYDEMMVMAQSSIRAATAEAAAQGVTLPKLQTEALAQTIRMQADTVAMLSAQSMADSAARQAVLRYGAQNLTAELIAAGVRKHLEELSDRALEDVLGGALTQAQNVGRTYVMANGPVRRYYASELLDQNTCDECKKVDEKEYTSLEAALADYPTGGLAECQGGPRCRGTLVAVYDEAAPTLETEDLG